MDGYDITAAQLGDVVEFINAWSPAALETAGTEAVDVEEVRAQTRLTAVGDAELEQLADELHQVFHARSPGGRRAALDGLIDSFSLRPTVGAGGQGWVVANQSKVSAAGLVVALWNQVGGDPDLGRLGTCGGDRCIDAFHDSTQAHTRRFCSLTCQNRAKVSAYRQRQRTSD